MAVSTEQYANVNTSLGNAQTTLSGNGGSISSGATSLIVAAATGFPASAQYRVLIENELLIVTGGAGTTTWTVTRGAEGTTAATHADGVTVTHLLTRDGIKGVGGSIILTDTDANRPAAGVAGRLFLPSDDIVIAREDGTNWATFGPVYPLTAPVNANYAWVNQGGGSVSAKNGSIFLLAPATAGDQMRIRKKTAPSTPYTITAGIIPHHTGDLPGSAGANFFGLGLCFRESGTGKLIVWSYTPQLGSTAANSTAGSPGFNYLSIEPQKWTNETTFSAKYTGNWKDLTTYKFGGLMWLQIKDDGTNLKFLIGQDGVNFQQVFSISRTDFMAGAPNEVGFFANTNSGTYDTGLTLVSWKES